MKHLTSVFVAVALLAGCSQRDICISEARGDLPVKERLAAQLRGDIARGFAIDREVSSRSTTEPCRIRDDQGNIIRTRCPAVVKDVRRVPRAINIEAERAKLRSLERRIASDKQRAVRAIAQCQAIYPEG